MAADYLPRVSSENCHYPFTYLGGLYHGCAENIENVTAPCERWGCFQVNYSAAVCAANIGKPALSVKTRNSAVADKSCDASVQVNLYTSVGRDISSLDSYPQNWGALGPNPLKMYLSPTRDTMSNLVN